MGVEFFKAYTIYETMNRGTLYYSNSDCVQKVINYRYWLAIKASEKGDEHMSTSGIYAGLTIIAIITCVGGVFLALRAYRRKAAENAEEIADASA